MTKIDENEVKRLAELAMLTLSTDETTALTAELKNIFSMIEEINAYDTSGIEQTAQVTGLKHVTRKDEILDYQVTPEDLLKGAPKSAKHSIEVPGIQ